MVAMVTGLTALCGTKTALGCYIEPVGDRAPVSHVLVGGRDQEGADSLSHPFSG